MNLMKLATFVYIFLLVCVAPAQQVKTVRQPSLLYFPYYFRTYTPISELDMYDLTSLVRDRMDKIESLLIRNDEPSQGFTESMVRLVFTNAAGVTIRLDAYGNIKRSSGESHLSEKKVKQLIYLIRSSAPPDFHNPLISEP